MKSETLSVDAMLCHFGNSGRQHELDAKYGTEIVSEMVRHCYELRLVEADELKTHEPKPHWMFKFNTDAGTARLANRD